MNLVPMRWPFGPREHWTKPDSLAVLSGTPINCIVLPWDSGARTWQPLLESAAKRGISVYAESKSHVDQAGLAGTVTAAPSGTGDIPVAAQSQVGARLASNVIALDKGVWPSIRSFGGGNSAGPTGTAWVESNGWAIRLARERAPGKSIWVPASPPGNAVIRPESYVMAVADAAAYGARWMITLDPKLSAGIAAGDPSALETWKRLAATADFFEKHQDWAGFPAVTNAGVLADFAGPGEHFAAEILNLAARRSLILRILFKQRAGSDSYDGLKAIVYGDRTPVAGPLEKKLVSYVEAGGLLVGPPALRSIVPRSAAAAGSTPRQDLFQFGKGRFAIAPKDPGDPYLLASDTQLILSRRHDLLRTWNGASMNVYLTSSADQRKAVLQVLNYGLRPGAHEPSVQVADTFRSARLLRVDPSGEEQIAPVAVDPGVELHLPALPVYAAVELTR
jgi:hypothetical protein